LPQLTYTSKLTIEGEKVIVERDLESERQTVEAKLPCLVSVVREINEPRLPTLMAIMAASKKPMNTWGAADLSLGSEEVGFNGSLVEVLRSTVSVSERKRIMLQGDVMEMAPKIIKALVQEGVLKAS
jgi:electron transfer flavoprotein beta subunit